VEHGRQSAVVDVAAAGTAEGGTVMSWIACADALPIDKEYRKQFLVWRNPKREMPFPDIAWWNGEWLSNTLRNNGFRVYKDVTHYMYIYRPEDV
jgi:hypothetical protein